MKTLYFNGTIITMDKNVSEAQAVLVEDDKIIAVGSYDDLAEQIDSETKLFNLRGMTLLPGFIESHSHAGGFARALQFVDLAPPSLEGKVKNVADVKEVLKADYEKNHDKYHDKNWLIGYRYDYNNFPPDERVTKFDLDEVATDIPILIVHLSYHAGVANSKLLELLDINENTIDPDDLSFERVPGTKEPNGVLKEAAFMRFPGIAEAIKVSSDRETWSDLWKPVVAYYAAQGYTSVKEGNLTKGQFEFLSYLDDRNELILDVVGHASVADQKLLQILEEKWALNLDGGNKFRAPGLKIIADGTLELWTAWLSEPYCTQINDNPADYAGKLSVSAEFIYKTIVWCLENNKQIIVHCIGDQTSETFIEMYQKALATTNLSNDIRPVMIHATIAREDQIERMKELNMTPSFLVEDVYYFDDFYRNKLLGQKRSERLGPWGWAKKLDMMFSLHHDSPVFFPNSMMALHTAVTRLTARNELLAKEHQISMEDALAALTIYPAYQYHEDDVRGSITVDKYADLVVLDRSPLTISNDQIKNIKVMYTIKDGQVIYTNDELKK